MNSKKTIAIISASPKPSADPSVSSYLADMANELFARNNISPIRIDVRKSNAQERNEADFAAMNKADALLMIFPLYFFCLPGLLMQFLEDYASYREKNRETSTRSNVYAVVNCGFPEPEINEEAVRVIGQFAAAFDAQFRFGVMIGGGGMILGTKEIPPIRNMMEKLCGAFEIMVRETSEGAVIQRQNISLDVKFPRKMYFFMGNLGWNGNAKKNGLKKKEMRRTPYLRQKS